ncbi:GNAT family N-acetyltransferase [bacterium]|nr:GNAT family N-acetyltransferase [bacterium]
MKKQTIKGLIIRPAVLNDCVIIKNLINTHAAQGLMRSKSVNQLTTNLFHYVVAEINQTIIGVCGLKIWPIDGVEIISSAVRSEFHGIGVGIKLNQEIIKMISHKGFKEIFLLTKQPRFYAKLGFKEISKSDLSYKTYIDCINCLQNKSDDPKKIDCASVAMRLFL